MSSPAFGAYIIGDEIISGKRQDKRGADAKTERQKESRQDAGNRA